MKAGRRAEEDVRQARLRHGIRPVFKRVDTCAAEFEAPYSLLYRHMKKVLTRKVRRIGSAATGKKKIVILGVGPTASGSGIGV